MNAHYGHFDIDSAINSVRTKQRRVYGTELKICKEGDLQFSEFIKNDPHNFKKKSASFSFDNCRDIFAEINLIKEDIERYKKIGVKKETTYKGCTVTYNFNKYAINLERKLQELYELL